MSSETADTLHGAESVKWDLSDLYESPDDPELEKDRERVLKEADQFATDYKGKISELTASEFGKSLHRYEEILVNIRKIGSYSHLIWSTNTENSEYGKLVQQANELGSEVSQKLAFYNVEWLKIDESKAQKWIESKELNKFRHYLVVSRLYKDHTLDEGQEQIMSAKNVTGRSAWNRYFDETMGAARFRLDGKDLTQQEVLSKLHSSNRELRKKAHASLTETFREKSRTLTFIFNTLLADKHTNDKLRAYKSWISSRNLANEIDEESVDALIKSVTGRYDLVQRYYRLKKELLGVEELFDYDRYAPLRKNQKKIHWKEAKNTVLEAFGSFDPQLKSIAGEFFDKNWIDASIRPGKRGGAYSASTVSTVHPYIFMNYDGQIRDVQTLAHELGHGVHQYLSRKQGELQSGTPLTTAETASVFGEMLVFEKLMEQLDEPEEQLAMLVGKIDDTIATVFRQISMNRFEHEIHTTRRTKGEMTTTEFSAFWRKTQEELYGNSVTLTEEYNLWWCYIPHFLHTPGYVYAYAFGELLVLALYRSFRNHPGRFSEKYLNLLEAGGSDWPHNLVAGLGLDIKDPAFWQNGLQIFEEMIQRAESIANDIK